MATNRIPAETVSPTPLDLATEIGAWELWLRNTADAHWRRSKTAAVPQQDHTYAGRVEDTVKALGLHGSQFREDLARHRGDGHILTDAVAKAVQDQGVAVDHDQTKDYGA